MYDRHCSAFEKNRRGMDSSSGGSGGHRFRRIHRQSLALLKLDPLIDENLEQWLHLNEVVQCYGADWVKNEDKYGHYENVSPPSFQSQIFEGPETDIETETQLASARQGKAEDATDDDTPSTSGRQYIDDTGVSKRFGLSPLPAYEPAFDWENERSLIIGQRIPETPMSHGLKISVKVLSLSFQAGLVEPFYGTICLYNRERREKLSEDFYFRVLPTEMQDLERSATEESGVTPSVCSRKEPVHLTEREMQKLQLLQLHLGLLPLAVLLLPVSLGQIHMRVCMSPFQRSH